MINEIQYHTNFGTNALIVESLDRNESCLLLETPDIKEFIEGIDDLIAQLESLKDYAVRTKATKHLFDKFTGKD